MLRIHFWKSSAQISKIFKILRQGFLTKGKCRQNKCFLIQPFPCRKRKSVIVRAGANKETEREIEKLNETNMSDIIDHTLSLIPDAGEML